MCVAGILLLSPCFLFAAKILQEKFVLRQTTMVPLLPVAVIKHPGTNNLRGKGVSWLTVPGYGLWWLILVVQLTTSGIK